MKTSLLVERAPLHEAVLDSAGGTVRQRLIAAGESRNGRVYSEGVLRAAAPLFDGVQTYADHPGRERGERRISDLTGWLSGAHYAEGAIWATRHFTPNRAGQDALALVREIVAGRAPETLLGASINAVGQARRQEGRWIVESITSVVSVDDVTAPAAGGGWFYEAIDTDAATAALLGALSFDEWRAARPDFLDQLRAELKTARQAQALTEAVQQAAAHEAARHEAQTRLAAAEARLGEREAALAEAEKALAVEQALRGAALPAGWRAGLAARLLEADVSAWADLIAAERAKVWLRRVPVHGAGAQVAPPRRAAESLRARPDEDVAAWMGRIKGEG